MQGKGEHVKPGSEWSSTLMNSDSNYFISCVLVQNHTFSREVQQHHLWALDAVSGWWTKPGLWKEVLKKGGGTSSLHVSRDERRPGISAERSETTCNLTCHV